MGIPKYFKHIIKKYEHDLSSEKKRQYKPDFYLPEYALYIEHFALDENGQAPLWFKNKNYATEAEWKKVILLHLAHLQKV